jgi:hypothetical protein
MTTQGSGTRQPFNNPSPQAERIRILKEQARVIAEQEERSAGTRAAYNNIVDPLPSGRWSKPSRGNDPATLYPALPDGPWSSSQPQPPPEEPLGYSVEDMLPVGEPHEISAALAPPAVVSPVVRQDRGADPDLLPSGSANWAGSPSSAATSFPTRDVAAGGAGPSSFKRRRFT